MTLAKLLRLHEVALEPRLDPLNLLLGLIASDGDESSPRGGYLHALGFWGCETKFDEHKPLYTELLVQTHRERGLLLILSHRRIKTGKDMIKSKMGYFLVKNTISVEANPVSFNRPNPGWFTPGAGCSWVGHGLKAIVGQH
jgi:hypothetical protein